MNIQRIFIVPMLLLLSVTTTSCAQHAAKITPQQHIEHDGPPQRTVDVSKIANAIPRQEARSKTGNPPYYDALGKRYYVRNSSDNFHQRGIASWYGTKFQNKRTSSGVPYDMFAMTAAHKTLPLPTYVKVKNLENSREVIVKVNDRGPFHPNRIIDLSYVAAKKLGMLRKGTALVDVVSLMPRAPIPPLAASSLAKSTPRPLLYMQIGSFHQAANAKRLQEKIKASLPHPVRIQTTLNQQNQSRYQVQIGPLADAKQFDQLVQMLQTWGIKKPLAVID